MKSIEAIEEVLEEDPRTRDPQYNWLFVTQVLRKLGFTVWLNFDRRMPSPETLFREKREILNRRNTYGKDKFGDYNLGDGVTVEKEGKKK